MIPRPRARDGRIPGAKILRRRTTRPAIRRSRSHPAGMGRGRSLIAGPSSRSVALLDEVMVGVWPASSRPSSRHRPLQRHLGVLRSSDVRRARWTEALNDWCAAQPESCRIAASAWRIARIFCVCAASGGKRWTSATRTTRRGGKRPGRGRRHTRSASCIARRAAAAEKPIGKLPNTDDRRSRVGPASRARTKDDARLAITRVLLSRRDVPIDALTGGRSLLACGDQAGARAAADELCAIASAGLACAAVAAQADGAVKIDMGDPQSAVAPLREAVTLWRELKCCRDRARERPGWSRVPPAGRRGRHASGTRGGRAGVSADWRDARSEASRGAASRTRCPAGWPDVARSRGAATDCPGQIQSRDRGSARHQ